MIIIGGHLIIFQYSVKPALGGFGKFSWKKASLLTGLRIPMSGNRRRCDILLPSKNGDSLFSRSSFLPPHLGSPLPTIQRSVYY